jgi:hypothetical protein
LNEIAATFVILQFSFMRAPFMGKGRVCDRVHKHEKEISDMHLGAFKAEGSQGDQFVQGMTGGVSLTRESLVSLAQVFSSLSGISFPRDFTRRRALVVKWFDDHVAVLEPLTKVVTLGVIQLAHNKRTDFPVGSQEEEDFEPPNVDFFEDDCAIVSDVESHGFS